MSVTSLKGTGTGRSKFAVFKWIASVILVENIYKTLINMRHVPAWCANVILPYKPQL